MTEQTFKILIALYIIGILISAWRCISHIISIKLIILEDGEEFDVFHYILYIILLVLISSFSWAGFIGGIIMFYTDENDNILFYI